MRLPLRFELSESVRSKRNRRKPSGGFVLKRSDITPGLSHLGNGEWRAQVLAAIIRVAVNFSADEEAKRASMSGDSCQRLAVKSMKPREKKKSSSKKASSMSA